MRFGGSGLLRGLGWITLAVIVVAWVVQDPHGAAHAVRSLGSFVGQAGRAFGAFVGSL